MNRLIVYLAGPELTWGLVIAFAAAFVAVNQPLTGLNHLKLIFINSYLPAIGVMLAFVPLFWAPGNQWGWLIRIGFSSLLGVVLLVGYLSKAASYDDIRDIGVSMGFILFVGIGWAVLAFMSVIAVLFQLSHSPFLPVLKWILILFTLFLIVLHILWRTT